VHAWVATTRMGTGTAGRGSDPGSLRWGEGGEGAVVLLVAYTTLTALLLCTHSTRSLHSYCTLTVTAHSLRSLCTLTALSLHSLCTLTALTLPSLPSLYTLTALSLPSLCTLTALSLHSHCTHLRHTSIRSTSLPSVHPLASSPPLSLASALLPDTSPVISRSVRLLVPWCSPNDHFRSRRMVLGASNGLQYYRGGMIRDARSERMCKKRWDRMRQERD
jgi:hypothetical protein